MIYNWILKFHINISIHIVFKCSNSNSLFSLTECVVLRILVILTVILAQLLNCIHYLLNILTQLISLSVEHNIISQYYNFFNLYTL